MLTLLTKSWVLRICVANKLNYFFEGGGKEPTHFSLKKKKKIYKTEKKMKEREKERNKNEAYLTALPVVEVVDRRRCTTDLEVEARSRGGRRRRRGGTGGFADRCHCTGGEVQAKVRAKVLLVELGSALAVTLLYTVVVEERR
jgi:hypothetical protein